MAKVFVIDDDAGVRKSPYRVMRSAGVDCAVLASKAGQTR